MEDAETIVRTIKIPIAEIVSGGTKQDFYRDLRSSLQRCVAATNRCLTECATIDREAHGVVARGEKVPKSPKIYTYPILVGQFAGCMNVAASLARNAERIYRESRFEILTGRRTLPIQRSCPLPLLCNKSTKMLKLQVDEQCNVLATFPLLNGTAYAVRLRGGSNYARQLRTIKTAIATDAVGDSKIWMDRQGRVFLGLACRIPPRVERDLAGILRVQTARDAFIVATKEQSETPFTINADHVKRWQEVRNRQQQRLRQDRKSGTSREWVIKRQDIVSRKFRQRLDSFTHEAAAHIVDHAKRRKVATLEYDGTIRSYFGSEFPYFEFEKKLEDKCIMAGIEFVKVTSDVVPADLDEPHVYFVAPIIDGKVNGRVKIGMTEQGGGKRKKTLEMSGGHELLVLATDKQPKAKLRQREKHYHAMFAAHRLDGQVEWFASEPVIEWLRAAGCLGNAGNRSQISQYMEA